jgi:hypothetical protein
MAKSHLCKVKKAFVLGGTIRLPGASVTLSVVDAKHLLEAGKVVLDSNQEDDGKTDDANNSDTDAKADAKVSAKTAAKAAKG